MKKVSAANFRKQAGHYQDMALAEPITITKHDRPSLVLMSFEDYKKLTGQNRRALRVSQLSDNDLAEMSKAKVSEEYAHFDSELED